MHVIILWIIGAETGLKVTETIRKRIYEDFESKDQKRVELLDAVKCYSMVYALLFTEEEETFSNDDYLDAFMSIGADSKNGTVRKSDVIQIIQEEFQLPIDMEELFQKQNLESDDLNFESFCILFDSSNDDNMSLSRTLITVGLLNPQCYLLFNETIVYLFNRQEAQDSLGMKSFFSISSRFLSTFPSFFYLVWRLSYKMSFSFLLIGCFRLFYSLLFWFI